MAEIAQKPLLVLSASAGSGKTYNLVMTYLKLVLADDVHVNNFAHIMAMTFTNKAALEMKTRIISALDSLGFPNRRNEKERGKALSFLEAVSQELQAEPEKILQKARYALKSILHQYEDFHVMTIDKFNLRLIRSFSRDLDLPADFQIVLDEDAIIEEVVDTILDNLDSKNQKKLTQLILNYSKDKLNEQESWNFQRDLQDFAKVLSNEKYFAILDKLLKGDFSDEKFKYLVSEIHRLENLLSIEATELYNLSTHYQADDLPGKSNSKNAYDKLSRGVKSLKLDITSNRFFTNTMFKYFEKPEFPSDLAEKSLHFDELFVEHFPTLLFTRLLRKNFHNMSLLQFIYTELEDVRKNDQLIRISEFNRLISDLIKKEDAPFIYEKLGVRYKHFLLDEFQDTSRLQWLNMLPLIHESISNYHQNLIVGDPKQSIYRFKNGLADQFVALPRVYNPEEDTEIERKSNYFESLGEKKSLQDNWRSRKQIVDFNNQFFKTLFEENGEEIKAFYHDVHQHPKGKEGGFVSIVSEEIVKEDEQIKEHLLKIVETCLSDGFEPGDVCILGNTKKECNEWARILTENGYKVVSSDSLLVDSDAFVKLCISYLQWRKNPEGEMEAKRFSEKYFTIQHSDCISQLKKYWKTKPSSTGKEYHYFAKNEFIREEFGSEEQFFFKHENLYGLLQGFFRLVHLKEINNPYLHHLADMVQDFDLQRGPDLELFLEEYDRKGKTSSIQIPENKDAIKIMTGHKSKGLEFPVVLIPSLDWSIDGKASSFLLEENGEFVYTSLSKNSALDFIQQKYEVENQANMLDKINLCYVMFTRPVERLYICNFYNKSGNRFGKLFHNLISTSFGMDGETGIEFTLGTSEQITGEANENQGLNFNPSFINETLWFPEISLQKIPFQVEVDLRKERRFGNQLHLLLSKVVKLEELDGTISSLIKEGSIELEFKGELRSKISEIFTNPSYTELHQNALQIAKEQEIIISPAETRRPDKIIFKASETIVVDYKTGIPNEKDKKQIKLYQSTLKKMGFEQVRAFLFYTAVMELVEC